MLVLVFGSLMVDDKSDCSKLKIKDNLIMEIIEIDFTNPSLVERYNQLFENCPHAFIQQSAYWAEVIKDLGPDKPIFLLCHETGQDIAGLPLYLYEHELGNILTSVPQPGPLGGIFYKAEIPREKQEEIYQYLLYKAIEIAERHHCITMTIITNPLISDIDLYIKYLQPHFIFENFTQYIPLATIFRDNTIVLRDYNRSSMLSRNLKKSKELDCIIGFCENLQQLQSWYAIHSQRHQELGAVPLNYRLFENIFHLLKPRGKGQLVLVQHNEEIASGCVYIYHKQIMDVFMPSMNSKYADFGVNYAITDYSLYWANSLGITHYNWQSSQNRQCGVYQFKKRWGSIDSPYYFVTKVLCPIEKIQAIGMENLKAQYPWHYVIPFSVFTEGFDKKFFKKG